MLFFYDIKLKIIWVESLYKLYVVVVLRLKNFLSYVLYDLLKLSFVQTIYIYDFIL